MDYVEKHCFKAHGAYFLAASARIARERTCEPAGNSLRDNRTWDFYSVNLVTFLIRRNFAIHIIY